MERRKFIAASVAASALALARDSQAQAPTLKPREYYQLRRYQMHQGSQPKLAENYFGDALIPALTRVGMGPIGAFQADFGTDTPAHYLLIPSNSAEALAQLNLRLVQDTEFMKAAEPFWDAPSVAPSFDRVESSLLIAFEGWPKLKPPPTTATKAKRIFQMRTYESPSEAAHVRKVEMFNSGEFECFERAGFHPVFFGDVLIGSRMPCLTYMLSVNRLDDLNGHWDAFRADAGWKKLSSSPRYAYEAIVSNITNLVLSPLSSSQI